MDLGDILVALLGGTVLGVLAKWVAPHGRDDVPLWLTIISGIGGVVIGTFLHGLVRETATSGTVDWWRHAWQLAVATVLVVVAAAAAGRRSHTRA